MVRARPGYEEECKVFEGSYLAMVGEEVLAHQVFYCSATGRYITATMDSLGDERWGLQGTPGPKESGPGFVVGSISALPRQAARCPAGACVKSATSLRSGYRVFDIACDTHK